MTFQRVSTERIDADSAKGAEFLLKRDGESHETYVARVGLQIALNATEFLKETLAEREGPLFYVTFVYDTWKRGIEGEVTSSVTVRMPDEMNVLRYVISQRQRRGLPIKHILIGTLERPALRAVLVDLQGGDHWNVEKL